MRFDAQLPCFLADWQAEGLSVCLSPVSFALCLNSYVAAFGYIFGSLQAMTKGMVFLYWMSDRGLA